MTQIPATRTFFAFFAFRYGLIRGCRTMPVIASEPRRNPCHLGSIPRDIR